MLTLTRLDTGPPLRPGRIALIGLILIGCGQGFGCSSYRSFRDPVALNPLQPVHGRRSPRRKDNFFDGWVGGSSGRVTRSRSLRRRLPQFAHEAIVAAPAVVGVPTVVNARPGAVAVPVPGCSVAGADLAGRDRRAPRSPARRATRPDGMRNWSRSPGFSPVSSAPSGGAQLETNYQTLKPPGGRPPGKLARAQPQ
ncbi:MAG: hypothetical protein U0800_04620 [Isosphaeraceae bacterium]